MLGVGSTDWFAEAMPDLSGEFKMRFEFRQVSICVTSTLFPYFRKKWQPIKLYFSNRNTTLRMICLLFFFFFSSTQIFKHPAVVKVFWHFVADETLAAA